MPGKLRNIIKSTCQTGKRWVAYVWDNRIVLIAGFAIGMKYADHSRLNQRLRRKNMRYKFRQGQDKVLSGAGVESLQHFIDYLVPGLLRFYSTSLLPVLQQALLTRRKPDSTLNIDIKSFHLGQRTPEIKAAKLYETSPELLVMDSEVKWETDAKVQLEVTKMGVTVPVEMSGLRFTGLIRLCFMPLLPMMPGFGALTVAVASEPFIVDFTLKVLGGDVACLPGLHEALEEIVTRAITKSLVWPNRVVLPIKAPPKMQPTLGREHALTPEEIAALKVVDLSSVLTESRVRKWRGHKLDSQISSASQNRKKTLQNMRGRFSGFVRFGGNTVKPAGEDVLAPATCDDEVDEREDGYTAGGFADWEDSQEVYYE
ncbi:hypothetical protein CYMTET_17136 [Cymbomonas tetramitiformis]|uniref:SMP-LTD domain-containing protein n=1 Tax=Cymbomonas tetramitiformis TaxID=36881 RepID=A0AAE0GAZ1_9CHLO|nr:hypothetical protein CYMTET_17136 [Cymbomonas tetramitiformis]